MTKKDFLYILADAMQLHEGWGEFDKLTGTWNPTRSTINHNPGNIKFVGQVGMSADANNFCIAPTPLDGKLLQIHDLTLKLTKDNTIRQIVSSYAPPSENNTEAYIAAVVSFFKKRNVQVTDTMPISDILNLPLQMVLVAIDQLMTPEQWASTQVSLQTVASYMPEWSFTTRYVERPITDADFYGNPSPMGTLYALNESVTKPILASLNEGQKLNALYFYYINNTAKSFAGGVQYGGHAVSFQQPETAFCNAAYQGSVPGFVEYGGRELYHEFIHALFTLTGLPDYLHQYLVSHGGYAQNSVADLNAVYADVYGKYKTGTRVVEVAKQAIAIAAADKNPADQQSISELLSAIGILLKKWFR